MFFEDYQDAVGNWGEGTRYGGAPPIKIGAAQGFQNTPFSWVEQLHAG
jgi:hypothetical protein